MTWRLWTLIWVVLVIGALGVLFLVARSLFRKGMALAGELSQAAERLSAVADEVKTLNETPLAEELAVFADPTRLRQERILAGRALLRGKTGTIRGRRQDRGRPDPLRGPAGT